MRASRGGASARGVALAILACSLVAAATPKPILAQSVGFVATTQANARRQGEFVVGAIKWMCDGTRCTTATMPSATAVPLTICQALAREIGSIGTFGAANFPMSSKDLQQCNLVVPAAAAAIRLTMPDPVRKPPGGKASRSFPVSIRTEDLSVTGTGRLALRSPFTPKSIRTEGLTVTGTGMLTTRVRFTPKNIRTEVLTVTGTGVSH